VDAGNLKHARSLVTDDEYLLDELHRVPTRRDRWATKLLRCLQILIAVGMDDEDYSKTYMKVLSEGIDLSVENSPVLDFVKRMTPDELISLMYRISDGIKNGDQGVGLEPWVADAGELLRSVGELLAEARSLKQEAQRTGASLRSAYSLQSKVFRTTVVAQKVQLSHDSATLTEEDKAFTEVVDKLAERLSEFVQCGGATAVFCHETWMYDSKTPYRDVFIPRPRVVFERSLTRPHDYLCCSCCTQTGDGMSSTLPSTALVYHLYLETGSLINVADLWNAFYTTVGEDHNEGGYDERTALVVFYRALADLKALGFVKASRKKEDHVAKLKWL
jgi:origin recognition complex subunit 3